MAAAEVDGADAESLIDHLVSYQRMLAGIARPFDEVAWRDLIRCDVERARDPAAAQNHDLIAGEGGARAPLSAISAPTLVIHGTADPMFPLEHGKALAEEISGARLLVLSDAGHGVFREDWEEVVDAIAEHTEAASARRSPETLNDDA